MTAAQRTEYLAEIDRLRVELETLRAHADPLADCLEALVHGKRPHTYWLDEGLDALIAYRLDATES